jgi:hypothetical protein
MRGTTRWPTSCSSSPPRLWGFRIRRTRPTRSSVRVLLAAVGLVAVGWLLLADQQLVDGLKQISLNLE